MKLLDRCAQLEKRCRDYTKTVHDLRTSRRKWKQKAVDRGREIEALRGRVKKLEESRAKWRRECLDRRHGTV